MLLDKAMPQWDRRELHRVATDLPSDELLTAVEELTWREVPAFNALMMVRFLGRPGSASGARVLDWFFDAGFRSAGRTADEILFFATQRLGRGRQGETPVDATSFRDFDEPGYVKMAVNFVTVEGFLVTETRVRATDPRSRRAFAAYWLAIRVGSGLIRRVWLRAIRSRARASSATR